jgi:putative addiction module killer protein
VLKPGNYELVAFQNRSGQCPYMEWIESLDPKTRERVLSRVGRLKWGQFGDFKTLDGGLYELRLFFGPGYRIYFAEHRGRVILILTGGDKSTQRRDIKMAKGFWNTYLEDNA